MEPAYTYSAVVVRWVDGDTVDLATDLGFSIRVTERFRLYGVNTPERGQPGYGEAITFNNECAPPWTEVVARTYKSKDKYGRYLAEIQLPDGRHLNGALIAGGFAVAYFGGAR